MIRFKGEESKMIALISKLFILFTRSLKKLTLTIPGLKIGEKNRVQATPYGQRKTKTKNQYLRVRSP